MINGKGILLIISGPSGAGKGTVVSKLKEKSGYSLSISATTRKPRQNEIDGVHYFFKSKEEFEKMIEDKKLLEYADFCGNYYGTPTDFVNERIENNKTVILEIEIQGALQVKSIYPEAVLIFLTPPSMDELEKRLVGRATETPEKIELRLKRAVEEIDNIDKYDYIVINDSVERAVVDIEHIVNAEKMKAKRNLNLKEILIDYSKSI
ncbi:MAG: guanylate kinase [Clostridiales bacterium]|nr:guanylate kinase [Clostridiales bacterium]